MSTGILLDLVAILIHRLFHDPFRRLLKITDTDGNVNNLRTNFLT